MGMCHQKMIKAKPLAKPLRDLSISLEAFVFGEVTQCRKSVPNGN
jgi:hypothetical protein